MKCGSENETFSSETLSATLSVNLGQQLPLCTSVSSFSIIMLLLLFTQSCPTLCSLMDCSLRAPHPWDFPGKNAGMGCHFCLQRIFPTWGLNLCLLCLMHWQAGDYLPPEPGKRVCDCHTNSSYCHILRNY